MKSTSKKLIFIVLAVTLLILATSFTLVSFASGESDAMADVEASLADYKITDTVFVEDDGYIGIPVKVSIFFDKVDYSVKTGYNGTPVIIYVVNTKAERVGTRSDTDIITSMLDRGYVVVTLDYMNNAKAVSPALDWSAQGLRTEICNGEYFTDSIFPSGTYYENYVVPAGCNVRLNDVFWEADKHSTEGTLEKIVEAWNNDFKGVNGCTRTVHVRALPRQVTERYLCGITQAARRMRTVSIQR